MDFEKYIKLVNYYFENDNREENLQNRVMIPFLEDLYEDLCVVDTSKLTKGWNRRKISIDRDKFAGLYTPDLLIASKWKLFKTGEAIEYKALIEIKTPTANDRDHALLEITEYLEKVPFVILTDCITWEFFMRKEKITYYKMLSLEEEHQIKLKHAVIKYPSNVCKRKGKAPISWNNRNWEIIKNIIKNFYIDKDDTTILQQNINFSLIKLEGLK
jgi:hypothetical protein